MIATNELQGRAEAPSLVHVFFERAKASAGAPAARFKQNGAWTEVSWGEMAERARRVAWALLALGVQKGDRVCLLGETRLEWILCDLGVQAVGASCVPIYQSNLPDECQYVAEDCGAKVVFVDSAQQAAKFLKVRARLPQVQHVVQFAGRVEDAAGGWVRTLESLFPAGDALSKEQPQLVAERMAQLSRDDLSTLIYTSGTTGKPKGVMLSHDAFVFEAEAIEAMGMLRSSDVELLFLPFAHVFAQVLKAIWYRLGHVMAFAESLERLIDNMGEVHPTFMAAVPRVFEKAYAKVVADGSSQPGLKGRLFRMTMAEFDKSAQARDEKRHYDSVPFALGRRLVVPKIREKLDQRFGGQLRFFISGGAPLPRRIAYFFDLLGISILEGYGLTETTAASCVNRPHKNKIGTVGPAVPGMELKIAPDGEVLIRGRGVMLGYFNNPQATADVLGKDGWFATGDIGELDSDGYLRITDRKKDIIVTAGGKNVAPQNIENALKTSPIVSQVVVHGDRRKYLVALVTVNEERARKIAEEKGVAFKDYAELTQKPAIREAVQEAVNQLNATLPSYETIKKFEVLPADFSQETGELTPTLKVKRKLCNQKFKEHFDRLYGGD